MKKENYFCHLFVVKSFSSIIFSSFFFNFFLYLFYFYYVALLLFFNFQLFINYSVQNSLAEEHKKNQKKIIINMKEKMKKNDHTCVHIVFKTVFMAIFSHVNKDQTCVQIVSCQHGSGNPNRQINVTECQRR